MKVVVSFSGGKDSQASLIWAVKKFGAKNIIAVFCDTGWEHPSTYKHIHEVCKDIDVKLTILKSKTYDGMVDLAIKRKRFPSTKARFCTTELKSIPMIDWILDQNENLLIIQGIRKNESESRSKMLENCRMFKYYSTPYGYDKNGKPKYHTYRKKDVLKWCKEYDDSILRPVFDWTGQQVIDYIIENGQKPNPLYYKGANRVGCFPCVMTSHKELKAMMELTPEFIDKVNQAEIAVGRSFFPPNHIPTRFSSGKDEKGRKYPLINDIINYLTEFSGNLFEDEPEQNKSCMSFYGICE